LHSSSYSNAQHSGTRHEQADVQRGTTGLTWSNDRASSACGHSLGICASCCKGSRCSCLGSCTSTRHIKASTARLARKADNLACLEPLPYVEDSNETCNCRSNTHAASRQATVCCNHATVPHVSDRRLFERLLCALRLHTRYAECKLQQWCINDGACFSKYTCFERWCVGNNHNKAYLQLQC